MQEVFDGRGSDRQGSEPVLDFERLDAYRLALEFKALMHTRLCLRLNA